MENEVTEQAKQRLRPNRDNDFYKMWLKAHKVQPSDKYREYCLCEPLQPEDQAHLDSIKADNV